MYFGVMFSWVVPYGEAKNGERNQDGEQFKYTRLYADPDGDTPARGSRGWVEGKSWLKKVRTFNSGDVILVDDMNSKGRPTRHIELGSAMLVGLEG